MAIRDKLLGAFNRIRTAPTKVVGVPGTAIHGGYIEVKEKDASLEGTKRYETYSEMLANTSIVAAGVRYFLNLAAKASWAFEPSEADADGRFAELAEEMLTSDPSTSWVRVVRRAAMYRFYGFSIQEWTARRRDDGLLTFRDIAPRAQRTIERWDIEEDGTVIGFEQRSPQTSRTIYLPRAKTLYIVDDTLDDSPAGLGLFRHLVSPANRLTEYERLEGVGFETDLRGIPIGRGPFTALAQMVEDGTITKADRTALEKPLKDFIENHVKGPKLGILLDSVVYTTADDKTAPSSNKQWDMELAKGSGTAFAENAAAIERLNRELARILGVEQLLLGSDSKGSHALSRDKTSAFFLVVDSTLNELAEQVDSDLLKTLWKLNGFDPDMMPTTKPEPIRFRDVEQIAAALRDMAASGAVLGLDDPAIGEMRDLLGLSRPSMLDGIDEALVGRTSRTPEGTPDDPEQDMPEDETST